MEKIKQHLGVQIRMLSPLGVMPQYKSAEAAGMDVFAAIDTGWIIPPEGRSLVPCGFAIAIPEGFEAQIRPRSGLAVQKGVTVLNAPGTIDSDYRGEVQVLLVNHGAQAVKIEPQERIAQMVFAPVTRVLFHATHELPETERGAGGFGSTGAK